jgi:hypothetical protein
MTADRTLDLQAVTVGERDQWIRAIDSAVNDIMRGMVDMIKGTYRAKEEEIPGASAGRSRSATTAPGMATGAAGAGASGGTAAAPAERQRTMSLAAPPSNLDDVDFLEAGEKLMKHGRLGKPKPRWINCSKDKVFWGEHNIATSSSAGYSSFILVTRRPARPECALLTGARAACRRQEH